MSSGTKVCVIGAGAVGLCAGVQVQEMMARRGVEGQVVMVADKFNQETTSDGAAGIFNPRVYMVEDIPRDVSAQWCVTLAVNVTINKIRL